MNVANGKGTDNVTQQTTATVTLRANRLALLSIVSVRNVPVIPTVAGWTLIASHAMGDINRVSIFRRLSPNDVTQSFVIDFGSQSQFFNRWSIDESSANVDTSGTNGSGAIVQFKTGGVLVAGMPGAQNCLLTFDAPFSSPSNSTFAAFGGSVFNATPTLGSGFIELSRPGVEPYADRALVVQYTPSPDPTADLFWSAPYDVWTGIALEIDAAGP